MDPSVPTREILWNIHSGTSLIVMYVLIAAGTAVGALGLWRRAAWWQAGGADSRHTGMIPTRLWDICMQAFAHRQVSRDAAPGLAHLLVYSGFLALLLATTVVFIDYDLGIRIYQGDFYLFITLLADVLGAALVLGCAWFAHRRWIARDDRVHSHRGDVILLGALVLLCLQGFLLEGLRIHVAGDPWALYSPVGYLVAEALWPVSDTAAQVLHVVVWWFHTATVAALIAVFPYTKFFHLFSSSLNLFFKRRVGHQAALSYPGDIETLIETEDEVSLGCGSIADYSWKQRLDLDACTSCGRCQESCPAYLSGKALSPKWMILDASAHARALQVAARSEHGRAANTAATIDSYFLSSLLLPGMGYARQNGSFAPVAREARSQNQAVQNAARKVGGSIEDSLAGTVMDEDVFWACTTCRACVEACPVGIDHIEHIVGVRRHSVLMEGNVPKEAQAVLRALETRGNPFGPAEDRANWATGLDVRIVSSGEEVDYLYWVGCVCSYDRRKQKIAQSFTKLLQKADISFGILGNAERCTGDSARRLGEEALFQSLAKQNIATLEKITFKHLVATCPHCVHVFRNEYPQLGFAPSVLHHSELLAELLQHGRLPHSEAFVHATFHDPCYLGRYQGDYSSPRSVLDAAGIQVDEMSKSREKAMCCGAGGGHYWFDMKQGERVNVLRTEQAAQTGAHCIATACPFCHQMMDDGVRLTDRENEMEVKDIAEVLWESY